VCKRLQRHIVGDHDARHAVPGVEVSDDAQHDGAVIAVQIARGLVLRNQTTPPTHTHKTFMPPFQ